MAHWRSHRQPGGEPGLNPGFHLSPQVSALPDIPWSSTKEFTLDTKRPTHFLKTVLWHLATQKQHIVLYQLNEQPWVLMSAFVWERVWVGECTGVAFALHLRTRLQTMQRKNICIIKRRVILASVLSLIFWIISLRWGCYTGEWGSPGFCSCCFSTYPKSLCKKNMFPPEQVSATLTKKS